MGSNCPSQNIQPAGAKLPANMRISPTYGCAIVFSLGRRREDALQRYAKTQRQEWLHIQVGLATPNRRDGAGVNGNEIRWRMVKSGRVRQRVSSCNVRHRIRIDTLGGVSVGWQLRDTQCMSLLAAFFAKSMTTAYMGRYARA